MPATVGYAAGARRRKRSAGGSARPPWGGRADPPRGDSGAAGAERYARARDGLRRTASAHRSCLLDAAIAVAVFAALARPARRGARTRAAGSTRSTVVLVALASLPLVGAGAAPLAVFVLTALASIGAGSGRGSRRAAARPDARALLDGAASDDVACPHTADGRGSSSRCSSRTWSPAGPRTTASPRRAPLRRARLGRRLAGGRPHAPAPRADGRARGARAARRARGRARAPPRGGRGAHADRPRPARLGRPRDQRDPRPRRRRAPASRDDPEAAREAFETIEEVARETVGEIDQLVGALREDGRRATARSSRRPALAALDGSSSATAPPGCDVTAAVRGDAARRSRRASTAAPTASSRRRSPTRPATAPADARVEVVLGDDALELTVANRLRRGRAGRANGGGHGIAGMRERAALLGGRLEAGPARRRLPRARAPARSRAGAP